MQLIGGSCGDQTFSMYIDSKSNSPVGTVRVKGEVHSRMAIYFLYANKKFIQKYFIHQNFSFQGALNPYEIFL